MADLDDFFAKKDRKKSKSSKKFSTTEEVAKKLEDTAKKTDKQKKERPIVEGEESSAQVHEQDEWKEFEEEKKDYTGLKIGNLTIGPGAENNQTTESSAEQQERGESGQEGDKKVGPWKKIESVEVAPPPEPEPTPRQETRTESNSHQPRSYVPPGLRNQLNQPQSAPPSRLKSKVAPDIHNEEFFPTLSKSSETRKNREGSFEVVQPNKTSNYRQVEQSRLTTSGPKLNLGNRYNTLSNDS